MRLAWSMNDPYQSRIKFIAMSVDKSKIYEFLKNKDIWKFTILIHPFVWGWGFLISFWQGCSAPQATMQATAYTLSVLAGWLVYLLSRGTSDWIKGTFIWSILFRINILVGGLIPMLGPKRDLWPFPKMLAHSLIISVLLMSLVGIVERLLIRGKSGRPSGAHPLADAEIDQPPGALG